MGMSMTAEPFRAWKVAMHIQARDVKSSRTCIKLVPNKRAELVHDVFLCGFVLFAGESVRRQSRNAGVMFFP
jgi:hypothetical protein